MEDDLKKMKEKMKTTLNFLFLFFLMENDLKKKWKTNQSTKINLIGCDTIVNSPSSFILLRICCRKGVFLHVLLPQMMMTHNRR